MRTQRISDRWTGGAKVVFSGDDNLGSDGDLIPKRPNGKSEETALSTFCLLRLLPINY